MDDSDDSASIALSSGDDSELEIFMTSGVQYLEQLQQTESDPASKAFILWSTRDFVNIPLVFASRKNNILMLVLENR